MIGDGSTLAIIGARVFTDKKFMFEICDQILFGINVRCFVFGKAKGPDTFGEEYRELRYPNSSFINHPAEWDDLTAAPCVIKKRKDGTEYNAVAGHNRNTLIAEDADIVIAFLAGESTGTKDTIKKAKKMKKNVYVVDQENNVMWISRNGEKWRREDI